MKGRIRIDAELCKGCAYCVQSCPAGIISISEKFNKSGYFFAKVEHPGKCAGCAICATVCPDIAIEVYTENGKKGKKVRR
jgi:2-oxoglutarate ferredoxin oxidoreductase subunit delta